MKRKSKLRKRVDVLMPLLDAFIEKHPLPWTIEEDWSTEIYDTTGARIISFSETEAAELFVKMAQSRAQDILAWGRFFEEYEKALRGDDEDAIDRVLEKPPSHWRT